MPDPNLDERPPIARLEGNIILSNGHAIKFKTAMEPDQIRAAVAAGRQHGTVRLEGINDVGNIVYIDIEYAHVAAVIYTIRQRLEKVQ